MSLVFTHDEINNRYQDFVKSFLSAEKDVKRTQLLPQYWIVSVPSKDFKVAITCERIGHFHGIEQWFAVVEEPNGEKSNYLLFKEEIEQWASEQRKIRGIEL